MPLWATRFLTRPRILNHHYSSYVVGLVKKHKSACHFFGYFPGYRRGGTDHSNIYVICFSAQKPVTDEAANDVALRFLGS